MDSTTPLDRRLENTPEDWKGPLVDVIDTAEAVILGIRHNLQLEPTPDLVVGLTRLVLEQKAAADSHCRPSPP